MELPITKTLNLEEASGHHLAQNPAQAESPIAGCPGLHGMQTMGILG